MEVQFLVDRKAVRPLTVFMVEDTHLNIWFFIFHFNSGESLGQVTEWFIALLSTVLRVTPTIVDNASNQISRDVSIFRQDSTAEGNAKSIKVLRVPILSVKA